MFIILLAIALATIVYFVLKKEDEMQRQRRQQSNIGPNVIYVGGGRSKSRTEIIGNGIEDNTDTIRTSIEAGRSIKAVEGVHIATTAATVGSGFSVDDVLEAARKINSELPPMREDGSPWYQTGIHVGGLDRVFETKEIENDDHIDALRMARVYGDFTICKPTPVVVPRVRRHTYPMLKLSKRNLRLMLGRPIKKGEFEKILKKPLKQTPERNYQKYKARMMNWGFGRYDG